MATALMITGDTETGGLYIGQARGYLRELQHRMTLPISGPLKEDFFTTSPDHGVTIEIWVSYNYSEIRIHVESEDQEKGGGAEKDSKDKCICMSHFSFGIITDVTATFPADDPIYGRYEYNVLTCGIDYYLIFEGLLDANFGKYSIGQYVIIAPGAEMDDWDEPLFCGKRCLHDPSRFELLILVPIHIPGLMIQWPFIGLPE